MAAALSVFPSHAQEASAGPAPAAATDPSPPGEIEALRLEVEALKAQIEELRARLEALAAGTNVAAPVATPIAAPPGPAPTAAPPPTAAAPSRSPALMNPAISAVFQAIGNTSTGGRTDADGFDLSEAEVAFESVVDPYTKVNLFLAFPAGETPEVEEGVVTTLALPAALQLKGGRFKSDFGRWNTLHTHAFPTVEKPAVLESFFGEESLTNDGLSLSWLIPNPWGLFLESVSEAGTARPGPAFNSAERALTWIEHLAASFNPTANASIETGLTAVGGRTGPSETLLDEIDAAGLAGTLEPDDRLPSRVAGADITWKWKPLQHNTERSFTWQTEVLRSYRDVQTLVGSALVSESIASLGGYTYLETQWRRRWKYGLRYDLTGAPDSADARLWAVAGVVRFIPSEFQEIRFEVRHTRLNAEAAALLDADQDDTRVFFEWIPVIGAHGAHKY
jgi:hypothetical protein